MTASAVVTRVDWLVRPPRRRKSSSGESTRFIGSAMGTPRCTTTRSACATSPRCALRREPRSPPRASPTRSSSGKPARTCSTRWPSIRCVPGLQTHDASSTTRPRRRDLDDAVGDRENAENELEAVTTAQLLHALGLSDSRRFTDASERARTSVREAIARSIAKISTVDATLAAHLGQPVHTGDARHRAEYRAGVDQARPAIRHPRRVRRCRPALRRWR